MRSILVSADRLPGMEVRLETALAIARANQGHITLLVDTPVVRYVAMDPMGGSYVASDALRQAMADDDAAASKLEDRLSREDIPFDVVRSEAEPVEALSKAARLADLVIVSRSGGLGGDLALSSRTPILALGDKAALPSPLGGACIAWDGGDEAACALRHAVPLLVSVVRDRRRWVFFGNPIPRSPAFHEARARRLLRSITTLGPSFVKLGQILAGRTDLLPDQYAESLGTLTDQVPPVPTPRE